MTISFLGTVVYTTFTADLTSQMTIGQSPLKIKSFQDIHLLGKRLIVEEGGAEESLLRNSAASSSLGKLYAGMECDQVIKRDCDLQCIGDILNVRKVKR